jgi:hypothetical protein
MSSFRLSTSTTIIDKHFFQNTYANSTRLIHIIPSMLVYNASGSDFFFFTNASYHPPRHCFFLSCPFRHCYSLSSAGPSFPFLRWPILSFPPLTHHVSPPHFLWEAPTVRFGGQAKTFGGCHRWARGKVRTSFKSLVYSRREAAGCSRFGGRQAKTSGWLLPGKRGVGLSCDLSWVVF